MKINVLDLIDFEKVDVLLEGFNKTTGFVTAILDLKGNVLSKSGWRQICTEFHRINPETSKKCTISDTVLAGKMAEGEKYHFYQCLNGLVDVAVPIVIKGEHIANLFSGQFFFEEPDRTFFLNQGKTYGFNENSYINALEKVPVVSKEKVRTAMEFLLNMTQMISEMTLQRLELMELNDALRKSGEHHRTILQTAMDGFWLVDMDGKILEVNETYCNMVGYSEQELLKMHISDLEVIETQQDMSIRLLELKTLKEDRFETYHRHRDGNVLEVEISIQYRHEENGQCVVFLKDITERKQAEKEKQKIYDRFRRIASNIPGAIYEFCLRPDGTSYIPYASDGFSSIYGITPEEVKTDASPLLQLIHPDDQEKFNRSIIESAEKLTTWHSENRIILPSGETIWLEGKSTPQKLEDGTIIWQGYLNNVTERKQAEEELRISEAKFRATAEFSPLAMYSSSGPDQKGEYINPAFSEIFGYTLEDVPTVAAWWIKAFPDEKYRQWVIETSVKNIEDANINNTSAATLECVCACKDGSEKIISWEGSNIGDQFWAFGLDLTDRIKTEKKIKESEERYRRLLTNLEAGVVVHSTDTSIILNNHRASVLLGLSDDQLKGKRAIDPIWKFIDENYNLIQLDEYPALRVLKTKTSFNNLILGVIRPSTNDIIWLSVNGAPVLDENNNIIEVLISFIEITEQVHASEEIIKLNQTLEQRVFERTNQLQLANKELESFSYSISHDLRAPLRAIYGFSQILASRHRDSLNEEGKQYMDYVVDASVRMEQLINDLLNYSRLGRTSLIVRPIHMKEIIDAVYSDYRTEIENLKGSFILKNNLPVIEGDESLLRQIFSNLIGNAIKYRRTDTPLEIQIQGEELPDGYLIKVSDNGIGIDEKHYEKIFNVFQRLHNEKTYPGTGIGLANVKKAVTMLGGTIFVESKVNSGSTFFIKFTPQKIKL